MIVFVDTREENYQRKSSPRKKMFGERIPVASVRNSEWGKKSFYSEESFVTNLEDPLEYLESEIKCSPDQKIFVDNQNSRNNSERRRKFLLRTGEVKEVWKLKLSCLAAVGRSTEAKWSNKGIAKLGQGGARTLGDLQTHS